MSKTKTGIGSSFDDFLKEEGMYEEAREAALLRVFAWKIREAMKAKSITKVEMAKRMNTSRSQLDRLLDRPATRSNWPRSRAQPRLWAAS